MKAVSNGFDLGPALLDGAADHPARCQKAAMRADTVDFASEVRIVDAPVLKQTHAVPARPSRATCEMKPRLRGEVR